MPLFNLCIQDLSNQWESFTEPYYSQQTHGMVRIGTLLYMGDLGRTRNQCDTYIIMKLWMESHAKQMVESPRVFKKLCFIFFLVCRRRESCPSHRRRGWKRKRLRQGRLKLVTHLQQVWPLLNGGSPFLREHKSSIPRLASHCSLLQWPSWHHLSVLKAYIGFNAVQLPFNLKLSVCCMLKFETRHSTRTLIGLRELHIQQSQ